MSENKKNNDPKKVNFNTYWIYGAIILVILFLNLYLHFQSQTQEITYNEFTEIVKAGDLDNVKVYNGTLANVYLKEESLTKEKYLHLKGNTINPHYTFSLPSAEIFEKRAERLEEEGYKLDLSYHEKTNWLGPLLNWVIPFILIIGLWLFIMRRVASGSGGPGAQIFNIGKSKAALFDNNAKVNVTFKDVAGLDEAKVEVMEVVDFLKHPKKYTAPGTGKTLLAKAVAGEAGVPFFSISGSDFVEMFVGVGASRVRDLFKQAREKAPCIVFIDEIDAIGRARGKGAMQGGNDERENTLNQLLVEMDGFSTDKGVILMAATNRPDVLDSALLRPGRFDRQIGIDRPDLKGREAIFKVHLKNIKIGESIKPGTLAEMTPGFAGADIANVCNEAALVAARGGKSAVDMDDFNYALDRVIGGLEKKNKLISPKEKEIIAYHEAGHAICGWYLEHASPLVKVTIVPRGIGTLGYAQYLPKEEYITRTEQLLDRICMTFGGRAAEKIIFDKISTGAQNDLDQVTKMAYSMIAVYGMNKKVGNVSFYGLQQDQYNKPYSDETASLIDDEVRILLEKQYERAQDLLKKYNNELHILAKQLLEKEVLLKSDVERLIGPRPYREHSFSEAQVEEEIKAEPVSDSNDQTTISQKDDDPKIPQTDESPDKM